MVVELRERTANGALLALRCLLPMRCDAIGVARTYAVRLCTRISIDVCVCVLYVEHVVVCSFMNDTLLYVRGTNHM